MPSMSAAQSVGLSVLPSPSSAPGARASCLHPYPVGARRAGAPLFSAISALVYPDACVGEGGKSTLDTDSHEACASHIEAAHSNGGHTVPSAQPQCSASTRRTRLKSTLHAATIRRLCRAAGIVRSNIGPTSSQQAGTARFGHHLERASKNAAIQSPMDESWCKRDIAYSAQLFL